MLWSFEAGIHQPSVSKRRITRSASWLWWLPNPKCLRSGESYVCHHLCPKLWWKWGGRCPWVQTRRRRACRDLIDHIVQLPNLHMGKLRAVTWVRWPRSSPLRYSWNHGEVGHASSGTSDQYKCYLDIALANVESQLKKVTPLSILFKSLILSRRKGQLGTGVLLTPP